MIPSGVLARIASSDDSTMAASSFFAWPFAMECDGGCAGFGITSPTWLDARISAAKPGGPFMYRLGNGNLRIGRLIHGANAQFLPINGDASRHVCPARPTRR